MERQHQSTSKEITQPTTSEDLTDVGGTNTSNENVHRNRSTDPHWLIHELNEILEKGMFNGKRS